eukprot:TRINITY_DN8102_c0_g1_i3.p1 TRINITY_DN8102_c0_g1~~TRINITY_DN8102_c0_g1_i3.p1  ORF type:complete len:259 (-),score=43.80 TRINITY_DN8102_c0_g1_i3:54-830(-)
MEEAGADASLETLSTWSGSDAEKLFTSREGLECELVELRATSKQQEQELLQLRKILAYTESCGSENEVPAGDESVAQLKHELLAKDLLIAELWQSLSKWQQELAEELSKRKEAQYKQIQSGREFCDLLHRCSEYQQEIIRLKSENVTLRQSAGQKPKANAQPTAKPDPGMSREVRSPKANTQPTAKSDPGKPREVRSYPGAMCDQDQSSNWVHDGSVWLRRAGSMSLPVVRGLVEERAGKQDEETRYAKSAWLGSMIG